MSDKGLLEHHIIDSLQLMSINVCRSDKGGVIGLQAKVSQADGSRERLLNKYGDITGDHCKEIDVSTRGVGEIEMAMISIVEGDNGGYITNPNLEPAMRIKDYEGKVLGMYGTDGATWETVLNFVAN